MTPKYYCNVFALCIVLPMLALFSESCKEASMKANNPSITVEEMERLITNQIPIGSSITQVAAFLDAHKIKHSNYKSPPENTSDFNDSKLNGKRDIIKGYMVAIVRDVGKSSFISWDIQMYFYFDEKGILTEYTIRKIGTGL